MRFGMSEQKVKAQLEVLATELKANGYTDEDIKLLEKPLTAKAASDIALNYFSTTMNLYHVSAMEVMLCERFAKDLNLSDEAFFGMSKQYSLSMNAADVLNQLYFSNASVKDGMLGKAQMNADEFEASLKVLNDWNVTDNQMKFLSSDACKLFTSKLPVNKIIESVKNSCDITDDMIQLLSAKAGQLGVVGAVENDHEGGMSKVLETLSKYHFNDNQIKVVQSYQFEKFIANNVMTLEQYMDAIAKHPNISEAAAEKIWWRGNNILQHKMTLDEALTNAEKYGVQGSDTGKTPPLSWAEWLFGVKDAEETVAVVTTPEVLDDVLVSPSNNIDASDLA